MSVIIRVRTRARRTPYGTRSTAGSESDPSDRQEIQDFKIRTDHCARAQIFVDDKLGREDFGAAADSWVDRHALGHSTKDGY